LNRAEETTVPSLPVESIITATLVPPATVFAVNPRDISGSLGALLANADLGGFATYTLVANVDVVTAISPSGVPLETR